MMKKFLTIFCIAITAMFLFGCMSPEEKQTQNDLIAYIDDINALETEINHFYDQLNIMESTADYTAIAETLQQNILPALESITSAIDEIKVEDDVIMKVHQKMIDGWTIMQTALTDMHNSLESGDYSAADTAMNQIEKAEDSFTEFTTELQALCDNYNIDLEME
ncbi:MAG: hypothetical protein U0M15_07225 [Bacillota bacterium]|nr:hypothetical protein [Bacillota bacterium]